MKLNRRLSARIFISGVTVAAAAGVLFFCGNADSDNTASGKKAATETKTTIPATSAPSDATTPSAAPRQESPEKIIVYYFHTTMRCPTCHLLETFAKSEVETSFADAIKSGKVEWKSINVEDKGNEHFNDYYKLYTKSIIISTVKSSKEESWKNLDQIWQLIRNEGKYRHYIRSEVKACLDGKCL